jgi:hypothetical protein
MESLPSALERHRLEFLLHQAETVRDYPDCAARMEEARKMIRSVLYEFALGRLPAETRDQILAVLQFGRTRPILINEEPIPAYQDEPRQSEVI